MYPETYKGVHGYEYRLEGPFGDKDIIESSTGEQRQWVGAAKFTGRL